MILKIKKILKIQVNKSRLTIIKNNIKYKESFSFAFLFSCLDLKAEPILQFSFCILILSLIVITCFTNVIFILYIFDKTL